MTTADATASKDFHLTIKVRNARMLRLMEKNGFKNASALARATLLHPTIIGDLLTMKRSPMRASGDWTRCAYAVSSALRCEPEDIWPAHLARMKAKFSSVSFEVGIEQLERMKEPPQLSHVSGKELRDILDKNLSPLESRILKMRFGLDGPELTQWETAKEIGTYTAQRICQIEAKALRKLKYPRAARVLLEKLHELE